MVRLNRLLNRFRITIILSIAFVSLASLLIWSMTTGEDSTPLAEPTVIPMETLTPTPTFNQKRDAVIKYYRATSSYRREVKNILTSDDFRNIPSLPTLQKQAQADEVSSKVNQYLIQLISAPIPTEELSLAFSRSYATKWATQLQGVLLKLSDAIRKDDSDEVQAMVNQLSNYQCDDNMVARNEIAERVLAVYNISDAEADYRGREELAQCSAQRISP